MYQKLKKIVLVCLLMPGLIFGLTLDSANAGEPIKADSTIADSQSIPTPEEFLGYKTGDTLTRGAQVIEYMKLLGERSDRFKYFTAGTSYRGQEMGYVLFSTPKNLKNWKKYLDINKKLADPTGFKPSKAESLIAKAPIFYMYDVGVHSTEVGPIEASIPTLYEFATSNDPELLSAMKDVITVFFVQHPDGSDDVVDRWEKYKGEPWFEALSDSQKRSVPAYGDFVSHDNNRSAWYQKPKEIEVWWDVFSKFQPPIYYDFHQGNKTEGMYNNTCFLPVEANPNIDFSMFEMSNKIIGEMYADMNGKEYVDMTGKTGNFKNLTFSEITMDYPGYVASMSLLHQRVGAGSIEIGCTDIASLGWGATYAHEVMIRLLKKVAEYKVTIQENRVRSFEDIIEKGSSQAPYAYIVPAASAQKDPVLADKMLNMLITGLVEVSKLDKDLVIGPDTYEKGSYVIPMNQPYGNFAKALLERQDFAATAGTGVKPYDVVGWTVPLQMGVNCIEINSPAVLEADMKMVDKADMAVGQLVGSKKDSDKKDSGKNFVLRNEQNNVVTAVFKLLGEKVDVSWSDDSFTVDGKSFPKGTIIIPNNFKGLSDKVAKLADDLKLTFYSVGDIKVESSEIKLPRIGLYMDWSNTTQEGWTRMEFMDYGIPFKRVTKDDIKSDLNSRFDVIVFPDMSESNIVNGAGTTQPLEFRGGMGVAGVAVLKDFVVKGGYVLTINQASNLIVNRFDVGVTKKVTNFYCPGSILAAVANPNLPAAYSFAGDTNVPVFYNAGTIFEVSNPAAKTVVSYAKENLMLSGFTQHEEGVLGTPAVLQIPLGKGQILVTGIKPENRYQSDNTFPIIFNFMLSSNTK